jgi:hypothetical protein
MCRGFVKGPRRINERNINWLSSRDLLLPHVSNLYCFPSSLLYRLLEGANKLAMGARRGSRLAAGRREMKAGQRVGSSWRRARPGPGHRALRSSTDEEDKPEGKKKLGWGITTAGAVGSSSQNGGKFCSLPTRADENDDRKNPRLKKAAQG